MFWFCGLVLKLKNSIEFTVQVAGSQGKVENAKQRIYFTSKAEHNLSIYLKYG